MLLSMDFNFKIIVQYYPLLFSSSKFLGKILEQKNYCLVQAHCFYFSYTISS